MATQVSITTEQKIPITFSPLTAQGSPATLDGPLTAEVVSGDVTTEVSADGLTVTIISGSTVGTAQVKVTGDGDLGAGVRSIEEIIDVTLTNAEAISFGIVVGAPEPK